MHAAYDPIATLPCVRMPFGTLYKHRQKFTWRNPRDNKFQNFYAHASSMDGSIIVVHQLLGRLTCLTPLPLLSRRAVQLLLGAFERLGVPVEWAREFLLGNGGGAKGRGVAGAIRQSYVRKRSAASKQHKEGARVSIDVN